MQFITTTITTVGYGENTISRPVPQTMTMFLEFAGIVFYGYCFQNMMNILKLSRTFDETIEERDDALDTWILKREKMANSHKGFFTKKTKNIFEFAFDYDIPGIFNSEFYNKLPSTYQKEAFHGPSESIKSVFSSFFKLIDEKSTDMIIKHMVPK